MCLILSKKETKERFKKKSRERYENPTEEEKTKSENMVMNDIEISQKLQNKG